MQKNNQTGISIIVCCYNSAERLLETIQHIALQKLAKNISCELILVNNASTDNTAEIAITEWKKYNTNIDFIFVEEQQAGLIYAREKGIKTAKYEYIVFCDDDNWLQEDYLQTAYSLMESNSHIGALGGQSVDISDVEIPEWFEEFKGGYAVGIQSFENGDISQRGYLWGAGLVSRMDILRKVFDKRFPFLLCGRAGNKLLSGDDSEICKRILLLGYSLYYDNRLFLKHFMPANRLTLAYKERMWLGHNNSSAILEKYDRVLLEVSQKIDINYTWKTVLLLIRYLAKFVLRRNISKEFKQRLQFRLILLYGNEIFTKNRDFRLIFGFYNKNK